VKPTSLLGLVTLAVVVGVASWALTRGVYDTLPPLPSYTPATIAVLAGAEAYWAWAIRSRVQRRHAGGRPMAAIWVARSLALAKASSLVGALAAGAYAGFLGFVSADLGAPQHTHDALVAGGGVAASALLVAAALVLERACRVPPRDDPPGEA